MDNPFIFNGYKGAQYFCDREEELKSLVQFAESGINVTLIAQRRMGKTGLIFRLYDELKSTHSPIHPVYVDIFATRNLSELNKTLASAILGTFQEESSISKRFLNMLKGVRPLIGVDQLTGMPQLQFTYRNDAEKEITLESLLMFLEEQKTPVLLTIDEFQQIRDYSEGNVEALLRTLMQRLHNVRFIFCGSKKHMMVDIFSNPQRPFFASTQFIGIQPISIESYTKHIKAMFAMGGKTISDEAISQILSWTRRHTYYTQRLCHDVYDAEDSHADEKTVDMCCDRILRMNETYFLQYKQLLTPGQWNFLIALAKEEQIMRPYANEFLSKYNIGATAVARRQLSTLIEKDLIFEEVTKEESYYTVADLFLMRWLEREY